MALTNSQYETITRIYEKRQAKSRRQLEERSAFVHTHIPGYRDIEDEIASVSVTQSKKYLLGDAEAISELKKQLHTLTKKKQQLLLDASLPADYLESVYECPDCKDTGYIDGKKCHCFLQAQIELLYEQSGIRQLLESENFSNLSYEYYEGDDLKHFQNTVLTCQNFIRNFNSDYHNLFFYGTVGTGKSFLSCCVAKELMESGHSVVYFSASDLFDTLSKRKFASGKEESLEQSYDDLYACDLFIIDDLGTEYSNNLTATELFSLINDRHLRRKATLISTNLSLEDFRNRYSDRIFSRITSNYELCKITGPDIRMYKKRLQNRK